MDIGGESAICIGGPHNEEQLNISDVFEAITLADPSFGVGAGAVDENMSRRDQPYVEVVEQPASKALRFRYECEGRSAGSIPGVNSTSDNKTYPTIKICGYTGQAVIVVSCVTKDEPYKAHPHNLVGREHCVMGVCTIPPVRVTEETCEYQFKNLGIQCVKRRDIADALTAREKLRVDPFRKNFDHKNHPQSIDLNAVRLCFQVFLPDESGRLRRPLKPVVSDVIYDKKAMSDLLIMRSSHCSGTARGGTQVILLCEKVTREDIEVVFYQEENGVVVWEEVAIRILVHKQVAIAFETPPYKFPHTTDHISAHFQLKRTSDNARSNSLPFEYIPEYTDSSNNKRRKVVTEMLRTYERLYSSDHQPIKSEPRDRTPPHHNISSPPLHTFAPHYEQNWGLENMQPGMAGPGPSHVNPAGHGNPFVQEMWQNQSYGQVSAVHLQPPSITQNLQVLQPNMGQAMSPNMQPMSPNMQPLSPNMQPLSPNMQPLSPNMQQTYAAERMSPNMSVLSPHAQSMSPNMNVLSPHAQSMSPGMGVLSPHAQVLSPGMHGAPALGRVSPNMPQNMGHMSPNMPQNMGHMSPNMPQNMGHISPNLVQHQQPTYAQQQQAQQNLMEQEGHSAASLTNLLLDRADGSLLLNSSELSGLSALLGERGQEPQPLDY